MKNTECVGGMYGWGRRWTLIALGLGLNEIAHCYYRTTLLSHNVKCGSESLFGEHSKRIPVFACAINICMLCRMQNCAFLRKRFGKTFLHLLLDVMCTLRILVY